MKLYATYGFLIALGGAILNMALFALDFHTVENMATGQKIGWIGILITIAGIALGMREYRNEVGKGVMSYGRGVGTGVLISIWSAVFSTVFTVIYFKFINPGFTDAMVQVQMAEMEKKGLPPATIEQSEGIVRFFASTPMLAVFGVFFAILFGLIISLILAAIFKSKPGQSAPPPVSA